MPNGHDPNGLPDLSWWQAVLGGLGAILMGWAGGQRRGRKVTLEEDSAATAVSLEASRAEFRVEHESTRQEVREILDAMREERTVMVELIRSEGQANRRTIHELGTRIGTRLETIDKDVSELLNRGPRGNGRT